MNFAFFSMFVCHPTHTHTRIPAQSLCMSVCLFVFSLSLSLSPHCGREFATVIKFHVSFTTCYNISIWLALALFVSYLFSACAAVAVLSMPQKPKREMWKKNYEKNIRSMQNSCQQNLYQPSELNAAFCLCKAKKRKQKQKRNWRDSFSVHAGQPVRPPYKVAPKFGFRRTLCWFVWPLAELTEWCIKLIAQPPN